MPESLPCPTTGTWPVRSSHPRDQADRLKSDANEYKARTEQEARKMVDNAKHYAAHHLRKALEEVA